MAEALVHNDDVNELLRKLRRQLKDWERSFEKINGRRPARDDISGAPSMKHLYKEYTYLKLQLDKENVAPIQVGSRKRKADIENAGYALDLFRPARQSCQSEGSADTHISATPPKDQGMCQARNDAHNDSVSKPLQPKISNCAARNPKPIVRRKLGNVLKCKDLTTESEVESDLQIGLKFVAPIGPVPLVVGNKEKSLSSENVLPSGVIIKIQRCGQRPESERASPTNSRFGKRISSSLGSTVLLAKSETVDNFNFAFEEEQVLDSFHENGKTRKRMVSDGLSDELESSSPIPTKITRSMRRVSAPDSPLSNHGRERGYVNGEDTILEVETLVAPNLESPAKPQNQSQGTRKIRSSMGNKPNVKEAKNVDESWSNPKILQKSRGNSRGNYVKLNINGKGSRSRKFLNRTCSRRPSAYGRKRYSRKKCLEKRTADVAADADILLDVQTVQSKQQLWLDEGWCEAGSALPLEQKAEAMRPLTDLAIRALENPTDDNLLKVLELNFGHHSFRNGQVETIRRVLSGKSTMLILPTGTGKSLCYQLPAYLLPGITLVISPLLALMIDQLQHLPTSIPGALINSSQSASESLAVQDKLRAGAIKVLFISPERLFSESFLSILAEIPSISLAVIDEAHCISEWSHNFRPSYYRLGSVLQQKVKPACVLAMTATATKETKSSILSSLSIPWDSVVEQCNVPQNLTLTVSRCESNKLKALLVLLQSKPFSDAQSIIIYVKFQIEADIVYNYLQSKGIDAQSYHGGKTPEERRRIQDFFCQNKLRVVVATVAFGMGLDKTDVRAVIHYSLPGSLEHYVQEIGRAGRDGNPAACHLFLDDSSYLRLRSLAYSDGADEYAINKLLARIFDGAGQLKSGILRSLIIEHVSRELDLKEEVIATVLSYLEVEKEQYLTVLSPLKSTCMLSFYKSSPLALAKQNALVAAIVHRSQQKNGQYAADLPSLATDLNVNLSDIQKELQKLQERAEIAYELQDQALCFRILRAPDDICALTSKIAAHLSHIEACKVRKLDAMYMAAALSTGPVDKQPQSSVQASIKAYFDADEGPNYQLTPSLLKSSSSYLRADIKVFLRSSGHVNFTGRAIARIFHGLGSPMYPVSSWSKNHFWGRHVDIDFHAIKEAATAELLASRTIKS